MFFDAKTTMDIITKRVNDKDPFFYVRFGDGELHVIEGNFQFYLKRNKYGPNAQFFNESFRKELIEAVAIRDDNYCIGALLDDAENKQRAQTIRVFGDINIYSAIWYTLEMQNFETFSKFLDDTFCNARTLFVASDYLIDEPILNNAFNVKRKITFPSQDAYYKLDEEYDNIKQILNSQECNVVVSALGHNSNILAKRLYLDNVNTKFLDVGSLVDGLIGREERRWITYRISQEIRDQYKNHYKGII